MASSKPYHILSSLSKTIHKHFKAISVILIKPYLFRRLIDSSKQKISNNKTMKVIENEY